MTLSFIRMLWSLYMKYFFIDFTLDLFMLGYIIARIGDKILLTKSPMRLMF